MKKTITIALLTAAVIGATFVLSSCSNKNDDDLIIDGLPDPVTIDLSKVFTNGTPKEVDSMTIQTNEKGLYWSADHYRYRRNTMYLPLYFPFALSCNF